MEFVKQAEMGVPVTCLAVMEELVRLIANGFGILRSLISGLQLIAGTGDGRIRSINQSTLRVAQTLVVNDAHRPIACLLRVGDALWLGVHQSIVKLQKSADQAFACGTVLEGHQSSVTCLEMVGDVLWSGSADGELRRWDLATSTCLSACASQMPRVFALSRAGERVWCGGTSSEIHVYEGKVRHPAPLCVVRRCVIVGHSPLTHLHRMGVASTRLWRTRKL